MDRKYDIQLNLSPYANYFLDGGNTGGMTYTPEDNGFIRGSFSTDWTPQGISPDDAVLSDYQQKMVNRADTKQAIAEKGKGFLDKMNSSGGGGWANAIAPAATNIANAFLDTEASTADRVAGALGIPALANQWRADTSKGDSYLKAMTSTLDSMSGKNYLQDASSTFGANNAVKLNNKQIISPISPASGLPSLEDFKGNWWRNMGASVAQGAASGSVGGPWGAAGGALTGFFGSLGGLFGRSKRAEKAYDDFLHKRDTLMSAQQNAFNTAVKNQTLSNMQALANGNMSQRISDMANIKAYGGNLYPDGGSIDPYYPESQDPTAVNWLSDWYRQRPEQMKNTFKPTRYNDYSFTLPKPNISGEYESIEDIPSNRSVDWETRKYNDINEYNNTLYHNLIDRAASPSILYRMDLPSDTKGVYSASGLYEKEKELPIEDINKSTKIIEFIDNFKATNNNQSPKLEDYEAAGLNPLDLMGVFTNQIETGKLPKVANTISYNMREVPAYANPEEDYYDAETLSNRIHETNHAIQNDNRGISRSLSNIVNMNKQIAEGVVPNSYLDSPEEIHSRMMQLRYETGLKPTDIITQDFINNNKDKIKALNLDRYTDQSLINLLNNVVDNNNVDNYNNIAAMGGNLYPIGGTIREGDEEVDQEPVYEGGELPEITVSAESMPWYEKAWRKFDRNVLKYPKYAYNYFFPDKNKFIVLDDNTKINRVTDESSAFGNDYILSNEFVEKKNPNTIRTARDFQYPNQDTLLGDNYIPLGNISTYYGIENGKLKAGKASDFEDDTFIVPNRTKNVGKIREIQLPIEGEYDWGMPWSDERAEQLRLHNEFMELNESFVNQKKYAEELRRLFDKYYGMNNSTAKRAAALARQELKKNHKSEYDDYMADWNTRNKELLKKVTITEPKEGYVITENNDTLPIPNFNATPKMYFADENGNAAFVSGLKPNIEKVNDYLSEHPSYPIMVDNGRFKHIIEGDDINAYTGGYMNPEDNYIIGIKQKAMGGNLYTDLSPNMINLWNNKQQIDQQKTMNQQFSLGLGNTAFTNQFAGGGKMTSADVPENMQYYANGGTHEENPYGGIQVGTDQQGTPNLAEEGEFRWNDFVFSDRINVDADLLQSFNLMPTIKHQNKKAAKGKLSYADMAKKYAKRNKELENDPITKNSMEAFMQRLANAQEYQKKAEQLEAQKQNELQDYKTALNKQNNNPMYGTMKYNGMGNAATQQGVNSGVDAGIGNPMSNADLSNVNRSGNEMMAAYGGNLFAMGGDEDPYPYYNFDFIPTTGITSVPFEQGQNANVNNFKITPTPRDVSIKDYDLYDPLSWWHTSYVGRPLSDTRPSYISQNNPNSAAPAVSTYGAKVKGTNKTVYDEYGNNITLYPNGLKALNNNEYLSQLERDNLTNLILPTGTGWGLPQNSDNGSLNLGIGTSQQPTDISNADAQYTYKTGDEGTTGSQGLTGNIDVSKKVIDKTTSNTNPDAAIPSDPKEVPLYSTAGKYAQFGKGIMPMIWDWANKTNVKYDPYQRDADRLEALANEGPSLRTADTIGGYRAPNLMDVERLNNSARAEGIAQMQAILDAANGNRGFVGAQSAQNNYNTQKGIGDNYVKAQEANNTERLQTDQFNHGINVANQNAINTMRQDNQRAEQTQHQLALSGTAQAAALRQKENLHADEVNTERMKNRATNQAAAVDNALNYFTTQAMENQELNTRNNDPTNPYWIDKRGVTHYTGDSGLTQAIRDEFGDDEYGRNGTFTGERLTEWNNLTKKYKAKDLVKHPELWRHLVAQQREANRIDAEKAKQAKMEELEALRGTYQSNLARLNALKDSGAIISDPSYNLYTGWADEDYSGNQGLLRNRNQALDQYITQIGNNYDRYLYEKQLAQNQAKALGGYLNDGQNNNNYYYSYTRI